MLSARDFLIRGLLAGLFAGIVAFGVAFAVGEPSMNAAIALEEAGTSTQTHGEEAGVPRSLQSTLGLLTGTGVAGMTLGGLLGVLSAAAVGRLGRLTPRATTLAVTAIGFVTLYVLPFVAYPPNPPAVGSPDTIGTRTAVYFIFLAISVIASVTAVLVGRRLGVVWGGWYATIVAVTGYLAATLTAMALMPSYDEVPANFPASLLYDFRTGSFITQLALWAVLGVVLAELVHRLTSRSRVTGLKRQGSGV